jgi:ferredoxin-type protein NapH
LSALQVLVLDASLVPSLWVGAGIALSLAVCAGRVFCGWICPYGLLSEIFYGLRRHATRDTADKDASAAAWAGRHPLFVRTFFFAFGLAAALWFGLPVLSRLSMPGELSLVPLHFLEEPSAVLAALAVPGIVAALEFLSGERLWCRFLCPQALCLALAALCNPKGFGIHRTASRCICKGKRPCLSACSLRLDVCGKDGPSRGECSQCGDCVHACAERGGALRQGFGRTAAPS